MRLALLADIHGNLEALCACLLDARTRQVDRFAFLGDLVGYGADPAAVVERIEEYASEGAVVVLGNHDHAVLHGPADTMNDNARAAIAWTRARLEERHLAFLASLPLIHHEGNMTFVHATADAPERWTYLSDGLRAARSLEGTEAAYLFSGHVHEPTLYYTGAGGRPLPFVPVANTPIPVAPHRRWLAIAGSVGQPRDGNPAASCAIFDSDRATLTWHRVPYDFELAAHKIRMARLPESLASRLEQGD